jgi:hypothetical protein
MIMMTRIQPSCTGYGVTLPFPRKTEVVGGEDFAMPSIQKPIEQKNSQTIVPWVALGLGILNVAIVGIGWKLLDEKIQALDQTVQQQKQILLDTMEQKAEQFV